MIAGICWYCYWGWAKPVADIYDQALAKLDGNESPLVWGPGHIVWGDENFEDHSIRWCLEHFDDIYDDRSPDKYTPAELAVVRWSLEEIAKLPEDVRDIEPDDYDGSDAANFPPSVLTVRR